MWQWIKNWFSALMRIFKSFIKQVFSVSVKLLIAEFKDFALVTVKDLALTDLNSDEKRQEFLKRLKDEGISRGKSLSTSVMNIILELAIQFLKNKGEI